jgi:hypothetical protein
MPAHRSNGPTSMMLVTAAALGSTGLLMPCHKSCASKHSSRKNGYHSSSSMTLVRAAALGLTGLLMPCHKSCRFTESARQVAAEEE